MFFRNLTMFRFPSTHSLEGLVDGLVACALKPVGPLEMASQGFISPYGNDREVMSNQIGDFIWITVGQQARLLPGSVINAELAKKLAAIEEQEGRKPGGRTRKRLKDEIILDLMPKAFIQLRRTDAIIDTKRGLVYVDTTSRRVGESVISEIRRAIGSFPALPLNAEIAPRSILTGWVAGEELPEGISLGDECELRDPVEGGAVIKCRNQELECDEISKHLEAGLQVVKVSVNLDDHLALVIGEDLVVRKLKFLDGALDKMEFNDADGLAAEMNARMALMVGEITRLFSVLEAALKISSVETDGQKPSAGGSAFELAPNTTPDTLRCDHYETSAQSAQAAAHELLVMAEVAAGNGEL